MVVGGIVAIVAIISEADLLKHAEVQLSGGAGSIHHTHTVPPADTRQFLLIYHDMSKQCDSNAQQ